MLLVRVACGKMLERAPLHLSREYQAFLQQLGSQHLSAEDRRKREKDKTRELLRMPSNRSCPDGYHSQVGVDVSGSRKSKTEVVVRTFRPFRPSASRIGWVPPCLMRSAGLATRRSRPSTSTRGATCTARRAAC